MNLFSRTARCEGLHEVKEYHMRIVDLALSGPHTDPFFYVIRRGFQDLESHPRVDLLPSYWQDLGWKDRLAFTTLAFMSTL